MSEMAISQQPSSLGDFKLPNGGEKTRFVGTIRRRDTPMHIFRPSRRQLMAGGVGCLSWARFFAGSSEPTLTKEQIKQFLLTAKVVKSERSKKGITDTWRLTLSDGTLTHDASFQSI